MRCEVDRVQLHAERDPLHKGEFTLFSVDLKAQSAEVLKGGVPGSDMLSPRTRSGETVCVEGGSKHESTHPSGRPLQTNRKDECIKNAVLR